MSKEPTVRPVSDEWVDLTQRVSDVSWEMMELVRGPYAAYGGDFLLTEEGRPRQVRREDFDVKRVNFISQLYELVARQFGLESSSELEQALQAMGRLNDGYGFNNADLAHYQQMRRELAAQKLHVNPKA